MYPSCTFVPRSCTSAPRHSSHRLSNIHISNFVTLKIYDKSLCTTYAMAQFDGIYLTSYPIAMIMCEFFKPILVKIANWNVWLWEFRSRSLNTTMIMYTFLKPILVKIANWKVWLWKFRSRLVNTTFAVMPLEGNINQSKSRMVNFVLALFVVNRYRMLHVAGDRRSVPCCRYLTVVTSQPNCFTDHIGGF